MEKLKTRLFLGDNTIQQTTKKTNFFFVLQKTTWSKI